MPYEEYYNIRLFDDLHNYLPDLLYADPRRFPTTHSILDYIRTQLRQNVDLYSNALRSHSSSNTISVSYTLDDIMPSNNTMMTALLSMLNQPSAALEPVIVRPTREQIQSASSIVELSATDNQVCAICQEAMNTGIQIRRLTHCRHLFHTRCIDTWFQRNVHCPVCRHDIRT